MNNDKTQVVRRDAGIVAQGTVREVEQLGDHLSPRKTCPDDDERQLTMAHRLIWLNIGLLKQRNDMVTQYSGILQRLQGQAIFRHTRQVVKMGDRAKRQHQMIVSQGFDWRERARPYLHNPGFNVYFFDFGPINRVRSKAARTGALMCCGSRPLEATSASIGVNNR